jgi:hypothetical protein
MGNELCVATGANPHSMGIYLLNNSSKLLKLSDDGPCGCSSQHRGFDAVHGKFKAEFAPPQAINANGGDYKCWVSGRDGSAVKPEGWFSYQVQGGGTLKFKYHYIDQTVQVESAGPCSQSVTATVRREAIDAFMPAEFHGSSLHFRVTLSDIVAAMLRNEKQSLPLKNYPSLSKQPSWILNTQVGKRWWPVLHNERKQRKRAAARILQRTVPFLTSLTSVPVKSTLRSTTVGIEL